MTLDTNSEVTKKRMPISTEQMIVEHLKVVVHVQFRTLTKSNYFRKKRNKLTNTTNNSSSRNSWRDRRELRGLRNF